MASDKPQPTESVSDEQIASIIRASFGSRAEVARCQPIRGGHCNTLYDIETLNPARHIVLRIAPHDSRSLARPDRTTILAAPVVYDLMKRAGVPTPEVVAVDGSRSVIDRDYIITAYVDAVPMHDPSVPPDARPLLMREVGRYMAQMHTITGDRFGWIAPDGTVMGSESWAEVFGELLAETCEKNCEAGVLSDADAELVLGCYRNRRAVFEKCSPPVLVHNDIWDPNILVKQRNGEWHVEAIIDTDGALFAEREFEFALWDGADPDLLSGYGTPLDASPDAVLRRKFYRMQLYMIYAWFYLVMKPNPGFQASAKKIAMDVLQDLLVPQS